jgi:hypothetical protein
MCYSVARFREMLSAEVVIMRTLELGLRSRDESILIVLIWGILGVLISIFYIYMCVNANMILIF